MFRWFTWWQRIEAVRPSLVCCQTEPLIWASLTLSCKFVVKKVFWVQSKIYNFVIVLIFSKPMVPKVEMYVVLLIWNKNKNAFTMASSSNWCNQRIEHLRGQLASKSLLIPDPFGGWSQREMCGFVVRESSKSGVIGHAYRTFFGKL